MEDLILNATTLVAIIVSYIHLHYRLGKVEGKLCIIENYLNRKRR